MRPTQTLPEFYAEKLRQLLPASLRSGGHFAVFRLEDTAYEAELTTPYSRRDFYKIMLGTGHATYHYADQQVLLRPDQPTLLFTNAQVPYGWQVHSLPYRGYCCVFTADFLPAHTAQQPADWPVFQATGPSIFSLTPAQAAAFGELFEKMLTEQASTYAYKYDLLFYYLMECVHGALKLGPVAADLPNAAAASRLSTAFLNLLSSQFPILTPSQRLGLRTPQEYAQHLAVHVNHLNRLLKAATGKTTSQLLAERLVQEARALLLHTDWPIAHISACLGFEEPTHFTRFFHRRTTCRPSALR